jgi:hypothetical protein
MSHTLLREPPGPGYRPDFRWGGTVIEVKSDPHSFRNLRSGLLQLAYYLADQPGRRGLLLLGDPRISDVALREEWRLAERTLRPELLERLTVAVKRGEEIVVVAGKLDPALRARAAEMIEQEARPSESRNRPTSDAVFLVLLLHWFRRAGPMTTRYLMDAVGCSYPTVAQALRRLGNSIRRNSDRRIQLWGFPAEHWNRVVANRDKVHPVIRYVDRSGQPRSPEALLKRARSLDITELAIGGVLGARHYYPELDLRGKPRLDLTLHAGKGKADLSFVERLDPALERTDDRNEPAALAVHVLATQAAFFKTAGDGLPFADEVDCLLSLYDARLDAQAKDFLDHLVTSVG